MLNYNIISTGSVGNAVIINEFILIDCGVSFKKIEEYYKYLKLVLLTHIHSDHFNKSTIKKLATERPTLRFGCCQWLVNDLVKCGVNKANIDIYELNQIYDYGSFEIIAFYLNHNVPNCGYKIHFGNKKMIYATDTNDLNGVQAKNYDLYMIEANYTEDDIRKRIKEKEEQGIYCYEYQVLKNHLSKEKADDFIYSNIGFNGQYVYMHQHIPKEVIKDEQGNINREIN